MIYFDSGLISYRTLQVNLVIRVISISFVATFLKSTSGSQSFVNNFNKANFGTKYDVLTNETQVKTLKLFLYEIITVCSVLSPIYIL